MYIVQVEEVHFELDCTVLLTRYSWEDAHLVPQMETDQEELQEAHRVASEARRAHRGVRIVKSTLNGTMEIVK